MQKNGSKKLLSFILCMALIVAMAFFATGCGGNAGKDVSSGAGTKSSVQTEDKIQVEGSAQVGDSVHMEGSAQTGNEAQNEDNVQNNDAAQVDVDVLGTGDTEFTLTVVDKDGDETQFEIHTDKETVGDALTELGFIEGEESEYGLYVKTVNGITADYDTDGVYWAFYVNDEYASSGVDSTTITSGESYSFKVE